MKKVLKSVLNQIKEIFKCPIEECVFHLGSMKPLSLIFSVGH